MQRKLSAWIRTQRLAEMKECLLSLPLLAEIAWPLASEPNGPSGLGQASRSLSTSSEPGSDSWTRTPTSPQSRRASGAARSSSLPMSPSSPSDAAESEVSISTSTAPTPKETSFGPTRQPQRPFERMTTAPEKFRNRVSINLFQS